MKKTVLIILIVVGVVIGLFILLAYFGYQLEKKEIEETTPKFEELYKEALVIYETDKNAGIKALEDAMYYGHSHNLVAYQDVLVTGYNEYYEEGLNLLAKHYREEGKKLEDEGNDIEALTVFKKIYNYIDRDEAEIYKMGLDVDLLYTNIKRLEEKMK